MKTVVRSIADAADDDGLEASSMGVLYRFHRLLLEHFILKNNYIFPFWQFLWTGYGKLSKS